MDAIRQVTENKHVPLDSVVFDRNAWIELCKINHKTAECHYTVRLETDLSSVSLEGMNQFRISVSSQHKSSDQTETIWAALEINLRQEMNSVSIADGTPYFFTITGKSLDLDHMEVDSSIHEVVDLGLMDHKILLGFKPSCEQHTASILFDSFSCMLIKASVSALLAQATESHKQVINNAGRLFASRQDYVRDMCNNLAGRAEALSASITNKALHNQQPLL
jgi:hypothetical protein